jgi:hypothetical protein
MIGQPQEARGGRMRGGKPSDVAIIGAGPCSPSIAAHLGSKGVAPRVFGRPMQSWRERLPAGVLLKSEGFASNLYDSSRRFTLRHFCAEQHLPYADIGLPVHLAAMTAFGLAFQTQMVPKVENRMVAALECAPAAFRLRLDDDETVDARPGTRPSSRRGSSLWYRDFISSVWRDEQFRSDDALRVRGKFYGSRLSMHPSRVPARVLTDCDGERAMDPPVTAHLRCG